ncbi:MAG: hypothetical protein CMA88_05165 [Euryarchaeota archaeon]|nr:hypothetical protein [Euryarchaeota archaeon]
MAQSGLEFYSSLVRQVEGECEFLRISGEFLVAGSSSGHVACWRISSGSEVWRKVFEGPCSDADILGGVLYFTESSKLHSIELKTGVSLWAIDLEGSSDFVRCTRRHVWATSSVYNFEIQDYTEGAVWKLGLDGEVIRSWKIEGRAWALSTLEDGVLMGLSRPKCGYAIVSELRELEYISLENENPVTVGNDDGGLRVFLGHSRGGVTEIHNGESSLFYKAESSVSAIEFNGGLIAGLESGKVLAGESFGSWTTNIGGLVENLCVGPSSDEGRGLWASTWGQGSRLAIMELSNGSVKFEIRHPSRIISVCSSEKTICFGDSAGLVFVLEEEVLRRRFSRLDEEMLKENDRSEMRRKIRGLRRE